MANKPIIVCIIGSSKLKDQILGLSQRETLKGKIVLAHGFFKQRDMVPITAKQEEALDDLMLRKIDLADEVLVCNYNGYMGKSTMAGVAYAQLHGDKTVNWLEPPE